MVCGGRVTEDQHRAGALDEARAVVRAAGAGALARRPWQRGNQPSADTDLVRFASWACRDEKTADPDVVAAGLRLLASARAELDAVEAALLFAARGAGLTWPQISTELGLASAQAAQQRLNRVLARMDPA